MTEIKSKKTRSQMYSGKRNTFNGGKK